MVVTQFPSDESKCCRGRAQVAPSAAAKPGRVRTSGEATLQAQEAEAEAEEALIRAH